MRSILIICFVILVASPSLAFDIVGVGVDPSKAQLDALRQVAECFGQVRLRSDTKVVDYQTVSDVIDIDVRFSAANLDKFYVGMAKAGYGYKAVYRFPDRMLEKSRNVRRDYYRKVVFITFERIGYSVVAIDSFGEVSRHGFDFAVPPIVRQFIRRCIWNIDDAKGFNWVKERS